MNKPIELSRKRLTVQPKQCRLLFFQPGETPAGKCTGIEITASDDIHVMIFDEKQGEVFYAKETRGDARPILSWIGKTSNLGLSDLPPSFYMALLTEGDRPIEVSYFIGIGKN